MSGLQNQVPHAPAYRADLNTLCSESIIGKNISCPTQMFSRFTASIAPIAFLHWRSICNELIMIYRHLILPIARLLIDPFVIFANGSTSIAEDNRVGKCD